MVTVNSSNSDRERFTRPICARSIFTVSLLRFGFAVGVAVRVGVADAVGVGLAVAVDDGVVVGV